MPNINSLAFLVRHAEKKGTELGSQFNGTRFDHDSLSATGIKQSEEIGRLLTELINHPEYMPLFLKKVMTEQKYNEFFMNSKPEEITKQMSSLFSKINLLTSPTARTRETVEAIRENLINAEKIPNESSIETDETFEEIDMGNMDGIQYKVGQPANEISSQINSLNIEDTEINTFPIACLPMQVQTLHENMSKRIEEEVNDFAFRVGDSIFPISEEKRQELQQSSTKECQQIQKDALILLNKQYIPDTFRYPGAEENMGEFRARAVTAINTLLSKNKEQLSIVGGHSQFIISCKSKLNNELFSLKNGKPPYTCLNIFALDNEDKVHALACYIDPKDISNIINEIKKELGQINILPPKVNIPVATHSLSTRSFTTIDQSPYMQFSTSTLNFNGLATPVMQSSNSTVFTAIIPPIDFIK